MHFAYTYTDQKYKNLMIWATSWQNQQNGMSDQSLRCPHEESLGP